MRICSERFRRALAVLERLTDGELNYLLVDGIRNIRRIPRASRLAILRIVNRARTCERFHMYAVEGADVKFIDNFLKRYGLEITVVARYGVETWFIRNVKCTNVSPVETSGILSRNFSTSKRG